MSDEAAYTATLKAGAGYEEPWIVIRAETIEQLDDRLSALAEGGVFASLGRAAASIKGQVTMGRKLGAEGVEPAKEPEAKKPAAKKPAAKKPAAKAEPEETQEEPAAEAPQEEAEKPAEEPAAPAPKKSAPAKPKAAGGPPKPRWQ